MSLLGKEWYGEFIAHKDGFKEGVEEGFKVGYDAAKKEFAEHKTGKWIDHSEDGYVECPLCGHLTTCDGNIEDLHYCFWRGLRMEVNQ